MKPGTYPVTVSICSGLSGEVLARQTVTVELLGVKLPVQRLIYTNWVYCDCLADYYQVELYSDRFFEILENFLRVAAQEGMNTVLLPAFTSALDTPVDQCRIHVQLVKITVFWPHVHVCGTGIGPAAAGFSGGIEPQPAGCEEVRILWVICFWHWRWPPV